MPIAPTKRRGKYIMEFCRVLGIATVDELMEDEFQVPEVLPDFDEIKPIPAADLDPHDMLDDLLAHKHFRGEIMDKLRKLHAAI